MRVTPALLTMLVVTRIAAADVVVDLASGERETFQSVAVENGKLRCVSKIGVLTLSPDVLGPRARARYFPETLPAPAQAPQATPIPPTPAPEPTPVAAQPAPEVATKPETPAAAPGHSEFRHFSGRIRAPRHALIDVPARLDDAEFFVHIPAAYDGSKPWGLLVFVHSDDRMEIPDGWGEVLAERQMLYVAPQKAGNTVGPDQRIGLAVAGALAMMRDYKIDPKRVFVSGFSGGARCVSRLGYYVPDLFSGVIPICGVAFPDPVPQKMATQEPDYGAMPASAAEARNAKRKTRFAVVTGETDWRRGNIVDVFHGGYEKEKFQARLWEVAGMGHAICGPQTLREALDFVENKTP